MIPKTEPITINLMGTDDPQILDMARAGKEMLTAIWFVDCPEAYELFMSKIDRRTEGLFTNYLTGIPVKQWDRSSSVNILMSPTSTADEITRVAETSRRRTWLAKPGIWLEYANGDARRLNLQSEQN